MVICDCLAYSCCEAPACCARSCARLRERAINRDFVDEALIRAAQAEGRRVVAWTVNDADTRRFFEQHGYFGLTPDAVKFFVQGMFPALFPDGRIVMESPAQPAMAPDGHGGLLAVRRSGRPRVLLTTVPEEQHVLGILMTGFLGIATTYIFGTLLTANGSIRQLNFVAFGGMLLNITMNLILIPVLYGKGSAIASMTTQIITALAQAWIAFSVFKIRPETSLIFRLAIFVVVVITAGYLSGFMDNRLLGYLFVLGFSFLFSLLIKLINLRDLLQILKNES